MLQRLLSGSPQRSGALTSAEVEPVLGALEPPRPLPARAYVDASVFSFESTEIFGRSWLCVGRSDEVELPGQWLRETIAGEPVLVVRGPDLRLRAFFDVCRHRGVSLVRSAACGRDARFECPYHGWTYGLDGRLAVAPFAPPGFDRTAHGLHETHVDVWHGFVFVSLAADAPPLASWLGETPPWLSAETLTTLRRGRRTTYEVDANWKLCAQNFQESHHFARVHTELEEVTPTSDARSWITDGPWLGGTMEIRDAETVSRGGSRNGRPLIVPADAASRVHDALLFPGLFTSVQPDYLLTYRLTPLDATTTRMTADIYFHPAAFVDRFEPRDVFDFWDRVNEEDRAICEDQQRNASSRAFVPACYATVEEGVHAFDRMVAKVHLEGGSGERR